MKNDLLIDNLVIEKKLLSQGYHLIAGVDEVGRGPLAGDVVCGAVIMDLEKIIQGITDSKKLSEKKRELFFNQIMENSVSYNIAQISPTVIDEVNILQATKLCMKEAVLGLKTVPDIVLVDALTLDIQIEQKNIVKGDLYSYTIGCASILAKVYRDRMMVNLDSKYPLYGFAQHKGYGTKLHIDAIKNFGPCEIHRKSFIKNFVGEK